MSTVLAWHFVGATLRDGSPVPRDGEWLEVAPPIALCVRGLHASLHPFDALNYAPGDTLCRVELDGEILRDTDKMVATRRRIIARMDAADMVGYFARMQALSVMHLWDAPELVLDYLMTGDEWLRAGASAAAASAAEAAASAYAAAYAYAASAARGDFRLLVHECFGID